MIALHQQVLAALSTLAPRDCRRDPEVSVWHLNEPGLLAPRATARRQALLRSKVAMLTALATHPSSAYLYLVHPDNPADYEVIGEWVSAGLSTYRIRPLLDLEDPGTKQWLFNLGNWQAYVAERPVESGWPDPARVAPTELVSWMSRTGLLVLVDSFHDDVSWVMAISEPLAA
jgi:hypothetical protein